MLFYFRGGGFFKIEWAETGLGRASSKEEAVGKNTNQNIESRVIFYRQWFVQRLGVHPRTTPFLVFKIAFVVSLPLRIYVLQDYGGAHPRAWTP